MKFNISNPQTGCNKSFEVDDEKKILPFYEKRIGAEVPADTLGDEFKGYVFKITGGNDKEGFPMFQGVLVNHRVRLLFKKGMKCFRERRRGQMKRKSVRGCIVGPDISALNVSVVQKGDAEVPGLTDIDIPARLGPKRATKIRRLFNLAKDDDVTKYVIKREVKPGRFKSPKIQRLITPERLSRKQRYLREVKERRERSRAERAEYEKVAKEYRETRRLQKAEELKQLKESLKVRRERKAAQKQRTVEKQQAQHDQRTIQERSAVAGH